jgi:hypothetical protein
MENMDRIKIPFENFDFFQWLSKLDFLGDDPETNFNKAKFVVSETLQQFDMQDFEKHSGDLYLAVGETEKNRVEVDLYLERTFTIVGKETQSCEEIEFEEGTIFRFLRPPIQGAINDFIPCITNRELRKGFLLKKPPT